MIPSLIPSSRADSVTAEFLTESCRRGFEGEIAQGHADRTVYTSATHRAYLRAYAPAPSKT